jgi:carbon storage regulator
VCDERGPSKDVAEIPPIAEKIGDCEGHAKSESVGIPSSCIQEVVMLVLSRKVNEKIIIDGNIVVTVVKIDRNQIRLGIEAPEHVPVFREEIAGTMRRTRSEDPVGAGI